MADKRITALDTLTTVTSGDYIAVDNTTNGTKKYPLASVGGGGGGGDYLLVTATKSNSVWTMNKTFTEIFNALNSGKPVFVHEQNSNVITDYVANKNVLPVLSAYVYDGNYRVALQYRQVASKNNYSNIFSPGVRVYKADTATGYPTFYVNTYVPSNYLNTSTDD